MSNKPERFSPSHRHPAVAHVHVSILHTERVGKKSMPYATVPQIIRLMERKNRMEKQVFTFVTVPIYLGEGKVAFETTYPIEPAPDSPVEFKDSAAQGVLDLLQNVHAPNGAYAGSLPENGYALEFEVLTDALVLQYGQGYIRFVPPRGWTLDSIKQAIFDIAWEMIGN